MARDLEFPDGISVSIDFNVADFMLPYKNFACRLFADHFFLHRVKVSEYKNTSFSATMKLGQLCTGEYLCLLI